MLLKKFKGPKSLGLRQMKVLKLDDKVPVSH